MSKPNIRFALTALLFLFSLRGYCQNDIDVWQDEGQPDSVRLKAITEQIALVRDPDSILLLIQEELELARKLNNLLYQSDALQRFGTIYYRQGLNEMVLKYDTLRLNVMLEIGDSIGIAQCYNNVGIDYKQQGNLAKAIEFYHKSLRLKEDIGHKRGVSSTLNNIGNIYRDQNEFSKAREYYNRALKINTQLKDTIALALSYNYLGNMESDEGSLSNDTDKMAASFNWFYKGLDLLRDEPNTKWEAQLLNNIGITHYEMGRPKRAIKFLEKSLALKRATGNDRALGLTINNIGNAYFELSDYTKALEYGEEALTLSQASGNIINIQRAAYSLYRVYKEVGRFEESLEMHLLNDEMNDSLSSIENTRAIIQQEYLRKSFKDSLEFAQKEAIRTAELAQKNAQVSRQGIILIATFFGLFLVLIIAILVYKAKKKSDQQNREKEVLLQEIHHRVKNNLSVIMSMLRLQLRRVEDEPGKKVLEQSIGRIKTMSLIHQNLYQNENLSHTNFKVYLEELIAQIMSSYQNVSDITFSLMGDEVKFKTDTSIPLALISFEWVNNIYKHAFEDKKGHIAIIMKENDKQYELSFTDNGKGISKEEFMASKDSLGAKIIRTLSNQVDAELFINRQSQGGTEFKLILEKRL